MERTTHKRSPLLGPLVASLVAGACGGMVQDPPAGGGGGAGGTSGSGGMGTGGHVCFAAGTLVATPGGATPIEALRPGDLVWAFDIEAKRLVARPVKAVMEHPEQRVGVLRLSDGRRLRVTDNHPFFVPERGTYTAVEALEPGTVLIELQKGAAAPTAQIESFEVDSRSELVTVYNITVEDQENYFADGILVHNKALPTGGIDSCFAAGTLVATPAGPVPIERLRVGDPIWAYDVTRKTRVVRLVTATLQHHGERPGRLHLGDGRVLSVTLNHPFFLPDVGAYAAVGTLPPGTALVQLQGEAVFPTARVERFEIDESSEPVTVYNITVEELENYFADGILVHNKSPPSWCDWSPREGSCDINECLAVDSLGGTAGEGGAGPIEPESSHYLEGVLCDPSEPLYLAFDGVVRSGTIAVFYGSQCTGHRAGTVSVPGETSTQWETYCFSLWSGDDYVALVGEPGDELANLRKVESCSCSADTYLQDCFSQIPYASCTGP